MNTAWIQSIKSVETSQILGNQGIALALGELGEE
jgi:hypothetical protein